MLISRREEAGPRGVDRPKACIHSDGSGLSTPVNGKHGRGRPRKPPLAAKGGGEGGGTVAAAAVAVAIKLPPKGRAPLQRKRSTKS